MPEICFRVRWPDDETQRRCSPSTVVEEYVTAGSAHGLAGVVDRSRAALGITGERVGEKFGFCCTGASGRLVQLERTASACTFLFGAKGTAEVLADADGTVR